MSSDKKGVVGIRPISLFGGTAVGELFEKRWSVVDDASPSPLSPGGLVVDIPGSDSSSNASSDTEADAGMNHFGGNPAHGATDDAPSSSPSSSSSPETPKKALRKISVKLPPPTPHPGRNIYRAISSYLDGDLSGVPGFWTPSSAPDLESPRTPTSPRPDPDNVEEQASRSSMYASCASATREGEHSYSPERVNQDAVILQEHFLGHPDQALFGVLDGHGYYGEETSEFVRSHLPPAICGGLLKAAAGRTKGSADPASEVPYLPIEDVETILEDAFARCVDELDASDIRTRVSGTTACVSYLCHRILYTCNVGDSRAVLARVDDQDELKAVPISTDHVPDIPSEKRRINRSLCGKVKRGRVYLRDGSLGLAMSRSIGDMLAREDAGVIPEPEIYVVELDTDSKYLIWATDGVWEFIGNQEAVDIIAEAQSAAAACELLLDEAQRRWRREENHTDDMTVVVVFL